MSEDEEKILEILRTAVLANQVAGIDAVKTPAPSVIRKLRFADEGGAQSPASTERSRCATPERGPASTTPFDYDGKNTPSSSTDRPNPFDLG